MILESYMMHLVFMSPCYEYLSLAQVTVIVNDTKVKGRQGLVFGSIDPRIPGIYCSLVHSEFPTTDVAHMYDRA